MPIGTIERAAHLYSRIRTRLFTLLLASQFKDFGTGSRIAPPFRFHGLNEMSLGERVLINRDCWILTISGGQQDNNAKLVIGSHAGIGMGATISAARQVVIGEHVLLARNVYISDHGHEFEDVNVPIRNQGVRDIRPVLIGAHTWIGQNACILPGVTIGQHCVIGANSVVNLSLPDYCVAVGAPAKIVKRYDQETRCWEKVTKP